LDDVVGSVRLDLDQIAIPSDDAGSQNSLRRQTMVKPNTPAGSFTAGQSALFQEMNAFGQHWVDAVQAQLNVTAELMSHLAHAHTLPEFVSACQQCTEKRIALVSEESTRLLGDYQRWMTLAAGSISKGFSPSASG
jgi:hypothetical protein